MKTVFLLLAFFSGIHSFAQKFDTAFYSVVNLGKITGEDKSWKTTATEYHYYFYYNDRGRGSVINATVNTDLTGKIQKDSSSGLDYYKAPFTSSFQKINDSLISQYNQDRTAWPDTGQYILYGSVPSAIEIFINTLLAAPRHRALTLSGDSASIKDPLAFNLTVNNKKIKLFLCDINYGPGSSPSFTWLDEKYHFFGNVGGWTAIIKKGYENLVDTLYALQETQAIPYYQSIYKQLTDTLPARLAIQHVTLFDAPNAKTIANTTVLIVNGIVTAVGNADKIKIPTGFTVIDGKGKTLLPGLWDTHAHYNKDDGIDYLSGGITHVRDMGNMPYIKQLQQNIRRHDILGPDISYLSGFIDKDDEYHGPVGKLVNTKAEAVAAVNYFGKANYDQVKIYSSIDTGWVKAMCTAAHKLHMRVAGHIPWHFTAAKAVLAGYDEITHLNMVMFNFFPDTVDTRQNRIKPIGQSAYTIDLNSPAVKAFITLLKEKKTVVEPTMNLYNEMFNSFPGDTIAVYKPVISWMPMASRKNLKVSSFIDDSTKIPAYKMSYKRMVEMLKLLYYSGVPLLAGTDGGNQLALQNELQLFVEAGIPANEVLKIAAYNPAKILNLDSKYGSIQQNRVADLILVDGNPIEKISDIRKVFMVITCSKKS